MKYLNVTVGLGFLLLLLGCVGPAVPQSTVQDGVIDNPSFGLSGFRFELPAETVLYESDRPSEELSELQQMAVRIYENNREWHPRGNERFYESFLMFRDHAAFLLITLRLDKTVPFDDPMFFGEEIEFEPSRPVFPLYNRTGSRYVTPGGSGIEALWTRGYAYEKNGWIHDQPGSRRTLFNYESCSADGPGGARYILMGLSLPEYEGELTSQMQEMIGGIRF